MKKKNLIMADEVEPLKRIPLYDDGIGEVALIQHMGTDHTICNAARVSFGQATKELGPRDIKLIKYLMKHQHTSPFEHCQITFRFTVPLFVRGQHHRHRTWAYNEISRRYTDYNIQFYEPKQFRKQSESNRQASTDELINPMIDSSDYTHDDQRRGAYILTDADLVIKRHHKDSLRLYNELIVNGVCREQARGVLPQNIYTVYYGSVSLLNAFKFIGLRIHPGAQKEIQDVAHAMLEILEELYPVATEAWRETYQKED